MRWMNTTLPSTSLSIKPVFENGLIMFARAYSDGRRTVSFEDASLTYHSNELADRIGKTHFGKGETISEALHMALVSFHGRKTGRRQVRVIDTRSTDIKRVMRYLDNWLREHDGLLHAVADEDDILVKLEGTSSHHTGGQQHFMVEGSGKTFYSALIRALTEHQAMATNMRVTVHTV